MAEDLLKGFPVVVEQVVAWGDMDSYRHVNNVVYFRYIENARIEYVRRLGGNEAVDGTGIGPILHSVQARFRRAVTFPDTLLVGARAKEIGVDRITLEHIIVSTRLGEITTFGEGVVVIFDYSRGEKVAIPDDMRRRINELEVSAHGD